MSKELKKATKNEVAVASGAIDFAADAGMGMEHADKSSFAIPFLTILQGLSPQLETVDGAKPGMFINTITNELFKEVRVIPCSFQRRYLRWAPRGAGGGYKGEMNPIDVETGKLPNVKLVNGVYLVDVPEGQAAFDGKGQPLFDRLSDTRNHFVLMQSGDGSWRPALVSMTSTQIKKSKRWMSRIGGIEMHRADGSSFNPPSFSHVYVLKTVKEENSKGSWWGFEIDLEGPVTDWVAYCKAKDFYESVSSGAVEVAPPHEESSVEPEGF